MAVTYRLHHGFDPLTPWPCGPQVGAVAWGFILALMEIPCLIGYTHIIFQRPFFAPYMPQLIRLLCASAIVHQLTMSTFSKLPFAVGCVQDAGLIFLSAIANRVLAYTAADLAKGELTEEDVLATVLWALSLATALLGLCLLGFG